VKGDYGEQEAPPTFDCWSAADEARLKEMLEFEISMENTALGRHQEIMKRELFPSIPSMTPAEKEAAGGGDLLRWCLCLSGFSIAS